MLLWTGETDAVGRPTGGYARQLAVASPAFGTPTAWPGAERRSRLRQEHEGRAHWRDRTLERAVLLMLVVSEFAWLLVYAAHRFFCNPSSSTSNEAAWDDLRGADDVLPRQHRA